MNLLDWERIDDGTGHACEYRAEVPGGWLIKIIPFSPPENRTYHLALTFLPDPEYVWGRKRPFS